MSQHYAVQKEQRMKRNGVNSRLIMMIRRLREEWESVTVSDCVREIHFDVDDVKAACAILGIKE